MAIEGPLRELGIHDVFQLLDLSRKTGRLRVTSALRDNEGTVYFDAGRVTAAIIRSNPHPLGTLLLRAGKVSEGDLARARALQSDRNERRRVGEILVSFGAITPRELERQVRLQIEAVVFELMSWQEGFFSFSEGDVSDAPADAVACISSESLLMEGARRIDEWTRIAHRIPSLALVPILAEIDHDHPTLLDLLPHEWEVLAAIDSAADLRGVAEMLGRSDFDVAKIAYGLLSTGVIELTEPIAPRADLAPTSDDLSLLLDDAREALAGGRPEEALAVATAATASAPGDARARVLLARALGAVARPAEAAEELRRALELDPRCADALMVVARTAVRRGELTVAISAWQRVVLTTPDVPAAARAREALDAATRLNAWLEAPDDV